MNNQKAIELLRSSKSERVFAELYKGFPKIKKLIASKGGTKTDAEDIFQEALIIFYKKAQNKSFTLTAKPETYVYSVCRFLWKDIQRKKGVTVEVEADSLINHDGLEEVIEKEEKLKRVEAVLDKISKKCQEIFELFYFKKKSMKEIAKKMQYTSERVARTQKYKCVEQAKAKI